MLLRVRSSNESKTVQRSAMWLYKYQHEEYIGSRAQHMHGNMIRQTIDPATKGTMIRALAMFPSSGRLILF